MPHMEDKLIAMKARHAVGRTSADISELVISCCKGVVELSGRIKRPRSFVGDFNVRKEFETIKTMVRHEHGVKDLVFDRVELLD